MWLRTLGDKRVNLGFEFWPWHLLKPIALRLNKLTRARNGTLAGLRVEDLEIGAVENNSEISAHKV
jgi:hypothetical protein